MKQECTSQANTEVFLSLKSVTLSFTQIASYFYLYYLEVCHFRLLVIKVKTLTSLYSYMTHNKIEKKKSTWQKLAIYLYTVNTYNSCHHRKWNRQSEFKSNKKHFAFHFILIPFEKAWIHQFTPQFGLNSRADWVF